MLIVVVVVVVSAPASRRLSSFLVFVVSAIDLISRRRRFFFLVLFSFWAISLQSLCWCCRRAREGAEAATPRCVLVSLLDQAKGAGV